MIPVPAPPAVPANALPGKNDHGRQRNMQESIHAEKRSLEFGGVGLRVTRVWRIGAAEPWQCYLRHHAERHHWRSIRLLTERCDFCVDTIIANMARTGYRRWRDATVCDDAVRRRRRQRYDRSYPQAPATFTTNILIAFIDDGHDNSTGPTATPIIDPNITIGGLTGATLQWIGCPQRRNLHTCSGRQYSSHHRWQCRPPDDSKRNLKGFLRSGR